MEIYQTHIHQLTGSSYREVHTKAIALYRQYKKATKMRPHLRSAYFGGEKIFLDTYWPHLMKKNWRDRVRRMKVYPCSIDLLIHSHCPPVSKLNPNRPHERIHRFYGKTSTADLFCVQVREDLNTGQKAFISAFPIKTQKTFR